MSGIVGIINFDGAPVDRSVLQHMLQRMAYRGPDAQNIWIDVNVGLGHALYRTYEGDIQQPFSLEHITVSAHVRIDAREELIPLLHAAGVEAALNAPDVELLAKAYLVWDEDCLEYLLGDFAFILWDAKQQKVFAARDHFGTFPLYYSHLGDTLIISSELGSIRRHPLVSTTLSDRAIGDFLVIHNVRWLDRTQTVFADITSIPPAHQLVGVRNQLSLKSYWLLPDDEPMLRYKTEAEYVEHFLMVFKKAVKDRMRSKRILLPLSGGLDSSCVAAMASELVHSGEVNADLNALTMVYDRIHPDTEAYYSGLVARKLHLQHEYFASDAYHFVRPLPLSPEPGPTLQSGRHEVLGRKTFSLAPVALEGHGGDEILGFSPLVEIVRGMAPIATMRFVQWQWQFLGRRPRGLGAILKPRNWIHQQPRQRFIYPAWLNPEFESRMGLKERFQELWTWTPPQRHHLHPQAYRILSWADWYLNGENLRERPTPPYIAMCPFLDVRVIRYVLTLPPQPWFDKKYLLRRAFQDALPEEILTRQKTPLGNIINSLLSLPDSDWVDHWQPVPSLEKYVCRDAVPPLKGSAASKIPSVDLRPLWLNEWLTHYET